MPSNDEKAQHEKETEEKARTREPNTEVAEKDGRRVDTSTIAAGLRMDVGLPWDKEWLKKSRDDVPHSDQPIPENPLMTLKPHGPAKEPKDGAKRSKRSDS